MAEEDRRIGQQMAIACAAMECEAREVAKEMFTDLVGNPKSDGYYAAFSLVGLSPMLAVAELFSKEELRPAVQRWQRADFDLPSDYMAFAESCAKIRRFDQLEWLYGQTESAELRLMVTVTALEGLVQNRK